MLRAIAMKLTAPVLLGITLTTACGEDDPGLTDGGSSAGPSTGSTDSTADGGSETAEGDSTTGGELPPDPTPILEREPMISHDSSRGLDADEQRRSTSGVPSRTPTMSEYRNLRSENERSSQPSGACSTNGPLAGKREICRSFSAYSSNKSRPYPRRSRST